MLKVAMYPIVAENNGKERIPEVNNTLTQTGRQYYTFMLTVKHGLVKNAADWPWSSFHHFAKSEYYEMG